MRCDGVQVTYSTLGQDGTIRRLPVPQATNSSNLANLAAFKSSIFFLNRQKYFNYFHVKPVK